MAVSSIAGSTSQAYASGNRSPTSCIQECLNLKANRKPKSALVSKIASYNYHAFVHNRPHIGGRLRKRLLQNCTKKVKKQQQKFKKLPTLRSIISFLRRKPKLAKTFVLGCLTCLRRSGQLALKSAYCESKYIFLNIAKRQQYRRLLHSDVQPIITQLLADLPAIKSESKYSKACLKYCGITPNKARHLGASMYCAWGVPKHIIARFAGHESQGSIHHYIFRYVPTLTLQRFIKEVVALW